MVEMRLDSQKIASKYVEYLERKEKNNEKPLSSGEWLWHVIDLLKVEEILTDDSKLPHVNIGHVFWREKPLGTGESSVVIIPLDDQSKKAIGEHVDVLHEIFNSTTDSEETIKYRIEELD